MKDTIAAYWGPRAETPEEAGKKLADFLAAVATLGLACAWYHRSGSPTPTDDDRLDTSPEGLGAFIASGTHRRDSDKAVMDDLGWRVGFWNGNRDASVGVTMNVGGTSTVSGLLNSLVINVSDPGSWREAADGVFTALVRLWEPRDAVWNSKEYRRNQPEIDGVVGIGWHTYLGPGIASRLRSVPEGVSTGAVGEGVWLKTGREPGPLSISLAGQIADRLSNGD